MPKGPKDIKAYMHKDIKTCILETCRHKYINPDMCEDIKTYMNRGLKT